MGLKLLHLNLHGLLRSHDLELGRDSDTGGQTLYVVELVRGLALRAEVDQVDLVTRLIQSKGQPVKDMIKDDKYQKWEKNNEGKDEIDYLQDVFKGKKLDAGVYIINKKAFEIDVDGVVNPIDLDSIIG